MMKMLCLLSLPLALAAQPQPQPHYADRSYVVHAVVVEIRPVPQLIPPDVKPPPRGLLPLWVAVLQIDKVHKSADPIVGEKVYVDTANHIVLGNGHAVAPRLNVGDSGVFAIQRIADGSLRRMIIPAGPTIAGYPVRGLPLIRNRDDGYEEALKRLSPPPAAQATKPKPK